MSSDKILSEVEAFLKKQRISATRFGALAAGDTKLVKTLRDGRQLRDKTRDSLLAFMRDYGGQ